MFLTLMDLNQLSAERRKLLEEDKQHIKSLLSQVTHMDCECCTLNKYVSYCEILIIDFFKKDVYTIHLYDKNLKAYGCLSKQERQI